MDRIVDELRALCMLLSFIVMAVSGVVFLLFGMAWLRVLGAAYVPNDSPLKDIAAGTITVGIVFVVAFVICGMLYKAGLPSSRPSRGSASGSNGHSPIAGSGADDTDESLVARNRTILLLLVAFVFFWWLSGIRYELYPGVKVSVTDVDTGKPIPQVLIRARYAIRPRLAEALPSLLAFGGRGSMHYPEYGEVDFLSDEGGHAGTAVVRRGWAWVWWMGHDHIPVIEQVLHPIYVPVKETVISRPWAGFAIWQPLTVNCQMQRLSTRSLALRRQGDKELDPRSFTPHEQVASNYFRYVEMFYWQWTYSPSPDVPPGSDRPGTARDYAAVLVEWRAAYEALGWTNTQVGAAIMSILVRRASG